jgi:pimeloyl-ACP methyl ester carboxylesterase/predicted glycosyltransferase
VLLAPLGWPILPSAMYKAQVPFLARYFRVVTYDPRGNGRSDRPTEAQAYADDVLIADALGVMDGTGTEGAVVVAIANDPWVLRFVAFHPDRVLGLALLATCLPLLSDPLPHRRAVWEHFEDEPDPQQPWARETRRSRLRDHRGFAEAFLSQGCTEPHSTKLLDDAVDWAMGTTAEILLLDPPGEFTSKDEVESVSRRVRCPVLVIHGDADDITPLARAERFAELTNGSLMVVGGGGHTIAARQPVLVNHLVKDFVESIHAPRAAGRTRTWTRALARQRRALFLSSPIGLGHAQRDVAIAKELRALHPELQIDWLAQDPVTRVLEAHGEQVHPASAWLASESSHIESEATEHDLNAFQAIRTMDEILVANFMVFHDVVTEEPYDLVVGDEAWDVDYFWHENPELKSTQFVWMTDFVGWLPMPEGGDREAFLTADYNAEMIEHVERFPRLRDRAIFVGEPDDVVPDAFGPGLPSIRQWTEAHYDFSGYVTGFDPAALGDRAELRHELGYRDDERVCLVTVGGSGVGIHLLRRVVDAWPAAKRRVPDLRMIVVTGPRIDPQSIPARDGLEIHGFVDGLYRHLAACDLAIVQGGLTTTMELAANRRPFVYVPLRRHFEQNRHVRHRLERYGAGRCVDYADADPDALAAVIEEEIGREVAYRPVETDGAARAATMIGALL